MLETSVDARERLIVALDQPDIEQASRMARQLEGTVNFFKFGLALQMAPGAEEFVRTLIREGKQVFLDYKYYDIAETLKKAVATAARLGVSFLTIHGTRNLIEGAVRGRGTSSMKLFTVTVLTALDVHDIAEMGFPGVSVEDLVLQRARIAMEAGCDGVVASGHEAAAIKKQSGKLLVVTPGIRPEGYPADDQKRKTTPRQAILAGADYLVVGRPITDQPDPCAAAKECIAEMQAAFDTLPSPVNA
jgi:orotidine-5'-phosphate decarboxylase